MDEGKKDTNERNKKGIANQKITHDTMSGPPFRGLGGSPSGERIKRITSRNPFNDRLH